MPHLVRELNSQPATRRPATTASAGEKYQTNPFLLLTHCYKAAYLYPQRTRFLPVRRTLESPSPAAPLVSIARSS